MSSSLRALLAGVIDYAGLFPPARLPLDEAIRNFARYRASGGHALLGRFLCPAASLVELERYHEELFQSGPPFAFSVLGRGGNTILEFLTGLNDDLDAITAFRERHGARVTVEGFEVRLPDQVLRRQRAADIDALIRVVSLLIDTWKKTALTPYFEVGPGPDWRSIFSAAIAGIAGNHYAEESAVHQFFRPPGFKLRCGGLQAAAFPTPEQVAFVINGCRLVGVPVKFTAGLHHPVRRFAADVHTHVHGFLNLLAAGVLDHARKLDENQVRQIIEDENAAHFVFDDEGMRWNDLKASLAEIGAARRQAVIAFGSCSIDEPREDLRKLGLQCS